ncbi:uncharacterized protein LOC130199374 isoform X3 [Pseudoliparis swirei]|uniref:uncharacterized protein LOC130199374 isoform X3 n=1 Tax=Pseudoliparis swirei TaxID=2059687 RepID=UPI0024BE5552|nr:uncharacterized protein LOC130199374 isoform X3 [Pseudoliparis swirei]
MGFFWRIYGEMEQYGRGAYLSLHLCVTAGFMKYSTGMSLPSLFLSLHPPSPLLFSPSLLAAVPKWAGGPRQTQHRAERSRGRSEGWRIDHVADVPLSPCVRTDALTPVGGDCGKGVSLSEGVLYSSLFPSSRHHGPLLLQSSGPARRSRTGSRSERRPSKPWPLKAGCDAAVYSHKPWALNHFHEQKQRIRHRDKRELPLWIFAVEAMWMLSLGLRRQPSQQPADCHLQMGNHAIQSECTCALINMSHCVKHFFCSESRLNMFVFPNRTNACGVF